MIPSLILQSPTRSFTPFPTSRKSKSTRKSLRFRPPRSRAIVTVCPTTIETAFTISELFGCAGYTSLARKFPAERISTLPGPSCLFLELPSSRGQSPVSPLPSSSTTPHANTISCQGSPSSPPPLLQIPDQDADQQDPRSLRLRLPWQPHGRGRRRDGDGPAPSHRPLRRLDWFVDCFPRSLYRLTRRTKASTKLVSSAMATSPSGAARAFSRPSRTSTTLSPRP